jgi:hypothetical protein
MPGFIQFFLSPERAGSTDAMKLDQALPRYCICPKVNGFGKYSVKQLILEPESLRIGRWKMLDCRRNATTGPSDMLSCLSLR